MAVAVTVPAPRPLLLFNGFLVIVLAGIWVIGGNWSQRWARLRRHPYFWIIVVYALVHMGFTAWANSIDLAAKALEIKISLALMPLLLISQPLPRHDAEATLMALLGGTALVMLCAFPGCYVANADEWPHAWYWVGNSLVYYMQLHRVYVALHLAGGLIILWMLRHRLPLWLLLIATVLALITLVLLGAKMVLLAMALTGLGGAVLLLFQPGRRAWALAVLAGLGLCAAAIWFNPKLGQLAGRLSLAPLPPTAQAVAVNDGITVRRFIWQQVVQVISEQPLAAHGAAGVEPLMAPRYAAIGLQGTDGKPAAYNAHNQFLEDWLEAGPLGALLFLALMGWPMWQSVRQKRYFYTCFMVLVLLCSQTECLLKSNKGVVWYALVMGLLAFCLGPEGDRERNPGPRPEPAPPADLA